MKRYIITFLLLWFSQIILANPSEALANLTLSGKVTDTDGNPLVGATIVVENTLQGTSTTVNGNYRLNFSRKGSYQIKVTFIGYRDEVAEVTVEENTILNFTLAPESIMGEAVVVSATRASERMPIAHTTVRSEEIRERNNGFDVPYLLEMIPSVVAVSEGGTGVGNTAFRIRGTDMTRINVTVNGIPLNDSESQGVWWVNMPDFTSSVDNIQVQRGVGTSTNGAGAFGATVNFQTVTLKPEPFAYGEIMGGSFNTFRTTIKAGTGLVNERFSFEGRYSSVRSDGYIERGMSDHQSLFFTGAWHTAKSILRLNLIHGDQHTGITWEGTPGYLLDSNPRYNPAGYMFTDDEGVEKFYRNETDNYTQTHYQLIFSQQLSRSITLNVAGHWTIGKGYYEQYKRNHKLSNYGIDPITIGDETFTRSDLIRQKWLDNDFYGTTYSLVYRKNNISTTLGGGWNKYDGDHFGNLLWTSVNAGIPKDYEWYRNNGTKTDLNIFAKANWQAAEKLNLFGDIQYRNIEYDLSGLDDDLASLDQSHSWDFINPKAGVMYSLAPSHNIYLSFGIAHREPTRADIKDAMKYGTDNTPKPEKLMDYELGYNHKSQYLSFGANLYFMDYRDQLVLTGKLSDVGYPLMTNVPISYRAGIETTIGVKPTQWLRWDGNISLSRNRIKDFVEYVDLYDSDATWEFVGQQENHLGDTDISFSPSVVGSSQLRFELFKGFGISLITKYVGSQYFDNTSNPERMLDAYLVNNAKVDYRFRPAGTKGIDLQFMVNNFLNKKYEANAWVYRAAFSDGSPEYREDGFFPQAGINLMTRIVVEF